MPIDYDVPPPVRQSVVWVKQIRQFIEMIGSKMEIPLLVQFQSSTNPIVHVQQQTDLRLNKTISA